MTCARGGQALWLLSPQSSVLGGAHWLLHIIHLVFSAQALQNTVPQKNGFLLPLPSLRPKGSLMPRKVWETGGHSNPWQQVQS